MFSKCVLFYAGYFVKRPVYHYRVGYPQFFQFFISCAEHGGTVFAGNPVFDLIDCNGFGSGFIFLLFRLGCLRV